MNEAMNYLFGNVIVTDAALNDIYKALKRQRRTNRFLAFQVGIAIGAAVAMKKRHEADIFRLNRKIEELEQKGV